MEDFGEDFRDGVRLAALVERLQRRRLRRTHRRPQSQHHEIENITIALDAIKDDGIKLVNIGESTRRGGGEDSSDLLASGAETCATFCRRCEWRRRRPRRFNCGLAAADAFRCFVLVALRGG